MPSRAAARAASPLVRTPSLARMAETWWSTGLGGDEQAPGDVGVAQPLGDQRQHLGLPGREVGRVGAGGGTGPSRQAPDPQLPQLAGDQGAQGPGAQPLELGQRRAELWLLVAAGQGVGGLVGAAERSPARGRGVPGTGHLQRERLGRGVREPAGSGAGRVRPAASARRQARRPARRGSWSRWAKSSASSTTARAAAGSPSSQAPSARATATGPSRCSSPVPVPSASASSKGGHTPGSPRRARTRPRMASAVDPADRRRPRVAEHDLDRVGGRRPASLLEVGLGLRHQHVQPPGVQVVLGAVADPFVAVAGGQQVVAMVEGLPGKVGVGPGDVLLQAVGAGQRQAPLQRGLSGWSACLHLGGADVVEGMDEDLGLAELLGQTRLRDRPRRPPRRCSRPAWRAGTGCCRPWPAPGRAGGPPAGPPPRGRLARRRRCGPRTRQVATASAACRLPCADPAGPASSPAPAPATRLPGRVGRSSSTRRNGLPAARPARPGPVRRRTAGPARTGRPPPGGRRARRPGGRRPGRVRARRGRRPPRRHGGPAGPGPGQLLAGSAARPGHGRAALPGDRARAPAPRPGGPARGGSPHRRPPAPGASRLPRTRPHRRARHRPPRPAARTRAAGPPPRRRPGPAWLVGTAWPPWPARRPPR